MTIGDPEGRNMAERQRIETPCPTCGNRTLFIGSGGHLVCSWLKCSEPGVERAVTRLKQHIEAADDLVLWALGEIGDFPPLPTDWPKRKFYWREELRVKRSELIVAMVTP